MTTTKAFDHNYAINCLRNLKLFLFELYDYNADVPCQAMR